MKSPQVFLLFLLSFLTISCVDTLTDYGSGIQPLSDKIQVGTDTFHLTTSTEKVDFIYSKPDSFLLGNFYNAKYGSTRADILAQVNCPSDFVFPSTSVADSVLVVLYCKTWFGDQSSPMNVNIYEMNKSTFQYTDSYPTNLDPKNYADLSDKTLLGSCIVKGKDTMRKYGDSLAIVIKLSQDFVKHFEKGKAYYSSDSTFTDFFKGIYITTNYGASTILNIAQIDLEYYYHYTYTVAGTNKLDTVSNMLYFPANKEVRQVNRFVHSDRDELVKFSDSLNYVASPANFQTKIVLPLRRINDSISTKLALDKKHILNKAILKVEATQVGDTTLAMPIVNYMLLIKESAVKDFFDKKELPSDTSTVAVLGQVAYAEIGTTGTYEYYYSYNVAKIIANDLKVASEKKIPLIDEPMVLVPVSVTTTSSSSGSTSITALKQQYKMSAVTIRSGKHQKHPMRLDVVFSGF